MGDASAKTKIGECERFEGAKGSDGTAPSMILRRR
jgi:hypothetical protein